MSIRDRLGDDLGAARARANLANAHSLQGEHEAALQLYAQSLEVFKRFGERTDVARTLANLARVKENTGKRDEAIRLVDEALAAATATGADPVRAQALQLLGEIQQKEGRNQESAGTFQELVDLTVRIRDAKAERDARMGLGMAREALNEIEPAVAMLREALLLTERHEFPARDWVVDHLAHALHLQGLARQQQGDLDGALKDFFEVLAISRQRGSQDNEGQALINIGNTQTMRKDYAEAAASFQRAAASAFGNRSRCRRQRGAHRRRYISLARSAGRGEWHL